MWDTVLLSYKGETYVNESTELIDDGIILSIHFTFSRPHFAHLSWCRQLASAVKGYKDGVHATFIQVKGKILFKYRKGFWSYPKLLSMGLMVYIPPFQSSRLKLKEETFSEKS